MDASTAFHHFGHYARVLVDIDLSLPIKNSVLIVKDGFEDVLINVSYENMPLFCHTCKRSGHCALDCNLGFWSESQRGNAGLKVVVSGDSLVKGSVVKEVGHFGSKLGNASKGNNLHELHMAKQSSKAVQMGKVAPPGASFDKEVVFNNLDQIVVEVQKLSSWHSSGWHKVSWPKGHWHQRKPEALSTKNRFDALSFDEFEAAITEDKGQQDVVHFVSEQQVSSGKVLIHEPSDKSQYLGGASLVLPGVLEDSDQHDNCSQEVQSEK